MTKRDPFLLRVGLLFDGQGNPPLRDAAVLIREGIIAAIFEKGSERQTLSSEIHIFDMGPESTLLPGLIDAHVHLVCTGGKAPFLEVMDQPEELLELRAIENADAALRTGVTTLRDAGARGSVSLKVRDYFSRLSERFGPRILASGMPITTRNGHLHFFGLVADTPDEVSAAVDQLADMGVDFIKVMASGGIQTPGSNALVSQYPLETLVRLVNRAHLRGLRVAAHAHSVTAIKDAIRAGVDTLEHFSWLGADADESSLHRLAGEASRCHVFVDPTAIALDAGLEAGSGLSKTQRAVMRTAIEHRKECLRALHDAGVEIVAGTDAGSAGVRFSEFSRGMGVLANLLEWDASRAIRSATIASAAALGISESVGSIELGKRADLVVVQGDPREDLAVLARVSLVSRDGALVRSDQSGAEPTGSIGSVTQR